MPSDPVAEKIREAAEERGVPEEVLCRKTLIKAVEDEGEDTLYVRRKPFREASLRPEGGTMMVVYLPDRITEKIDVVGHRRKDADNRSEEIVDWCRAEFTEAFGAGGKTRGRP